MSNSWIKWEGGARPVSEGQLVQCICTGGSEDRPGPSMRAGDLDWSHRINPATEAPHHGNIIAYRITAVLKISMYVPTYGNTETHFEAMGVNTDPRPLLRRAIEALEAELAEVDKCPVHRHRDSDGPRMAETAPQARGEAGPARAEGIAKPDSPNPGA